MSADSRALVARSDLPEHEALRLLVAASGHGRSSLLAGTPVTDDERDAFRTLERRRLEGEPLQYIEGEVAFGPVVLTVDERALIPRPETEELFHLVVDLVDDPAVIVDLCTGSGNLAIALAATFPEADVYATEISPAAADLARENVTNNRVDVTILEGDLFAPLPSGIRGRVDLVVSNPPYLSEAELAEVPSDVAAEPQLALMGGTRGTEIVERIADRVSAWIGPDGVVACEISEFAADSTLGLFASVDATVVRDMFGKDRFVFGHARVE